MNEMNLLILGLLLFIGIHIVPWIPGLRAAAAGRLGPGAYRGIFSVVAVVGLVLIVIGYARAGSELLYSPPSWGRMINPLMVWAAFILLPAAHMKGNIKRYTRHPMLWGVVLWGAAHLLVRGDTKSVVLFAGLVLYSVLAMLSGNLRGVKKSTQVYPLKNDLIVVAAGTTVFVLFALTHRWLFGVPALPWSL